MISTSADDFCNRLDHGIDRWRRSVTAKYGDGSAADRPREAWPTAGEDRDQRHAQGCSKVQQSCIHADHKLRTGDQCRDLVERLALLDARAGDRSANVRAARALQIGPTKHSQLGIPVEPFSEGDPMLLRPKFLRPSRGVKQQSM